MAFMVVQFSRFLWLSFYTKSNLKGELEEVYGRSESEIKKARKMEQHLIVMGDMNCKISDLIDGNKEEISKGGKIMIKMIKKYDHPK